MGQQQPVTENRRFGKYLRKIRVERRLSLDAVEEMSLSLPERVTKSHLSRIENGQAIPSFPRMFTLSQIYGVPVSSLAERFEICLKTDMLPADQRQSSFDEVYDRAVALRHAGRYSEALLFYESLLERVDELPEEDRAKRTIDIELQCIGALIRLSRWEMAKGKCETLLNAPRLDARQQVNALHSLAQCCYRLGKRTVAMMAIDQAERTLAGHPELSDLGANLSMIKGNICAHAEQFADASEAYRAARTIYVEHSLPFEACRARLNMAACSVELGAHSRARAMLREVIATAEAAGYDRQHAYALSHLALLSFREGDLDGCEAYCLRSNRLARPREYASILFRNCFYLWRIAQARDDPAGIKTNDRTLRALLNRIERFMPEAEEFKAFLGGGKK